ncbi:MAG: hypothetical protein AAF909_15000, partial [Pseudomonadota bacterium]
MLDIFDSATTQTIAGLAQAGVTPAVAIFAVLTSLAGLLAAVTFAGRLGTKTRAMACPMENGAGPSPRAQNPVEAAAAAFRPAAPLPVTPLAHPGAPSAKPS